MLIKARRALTPTLVVAQLALTLLFAGAIYLVPQLAVDIRFFLFSSHTGNINDFSADKQSFDTKYDFHDAAKDDVPPVYRQHLLGQLHLPSGLPVSPTRVELIKKIVMTFSVNGGGRCGSYSTMLENFRLLREGVGCCADHSAALMVAAGEMSVFVREVHHRLHTFNEFYDPGLRKWVWVDPMFAVMAKDNQGRYLSLIELAAAVKAGDRVNYDFFGGPRHVFSKIAPSSHPFYRDRENFDWLAITLGNNILEYDAFRAKVSWLPKAPQQFLAYMAGLKPGYLVYHSSRMGLVVAVILKNVCWTLVIFYLINMFYLTWKCMTFFVRKLSGRRVTQLKVVF